MTARLAIALPVYNGERYLGAALEALLAQTYTDFELLICDNASTDSTRDIAEAYARQDPRVRVHRNAENVGAARNFNLAFEKTRGPYFKWAAHDDICLPDYLAECMAALEADDTIALCHSEIQLIDESGAVVRSHDEGLPHAGSPKPSERFRDLILADHWCIDVFGVLRRAVVRRTGLLGSFVGSDRNLLAELALLGRFHRVPRRLFQNRDHPRRSVHATDLRSSERAAWFDPQRPASVTLPFVRSWLEYLRSVERVPLPAAERLACYGALASWVVPNRWQLRRDVEHALGALGARVRGRRTRVS